MDHPRDRETLVRSLAIFVERDGWHDIADNEERCDVAELCLGGWRSHWTSTLRVATVLNEPAYIEAQSPQRDDQCDKLGQGCENNQTERRRDRGPGGPID